MRSVAPSLNPRNACRQTGFTLVELLVALVIALFLLAGLFTIEQSTRKTSAQQTELAELQDNERLAMTIMTDVIQAAGYFADPFTNTSSVLYTGTVPGGANPSFVSTQGIYGLTPAGNADQIYVQFMSEGPAFDNMVLCNGQQTAAAAAPGTTYINEFSVDTVNQQLLCTVYKNNGATVTAIPNQPVALVGDVQGLSVLYGVATLGTNAYSVDTYMTATQVTNSSNWPNVSSVRIRITFTNPLCRTAPTCQPGQLGTVVFERVIGLMARAGV